MGQIQTTMHGIHLLAVIIYFALIWYSFRFRKIRVAKALVVFFSMCAWWSLFAFLIEVAPTLEIKILLNRLKMISPIFIPVSILYLAVEVSGHRFSKLVWGLILAIPVTAAAIIMSPYHEQIISGYRIEFIKDAKVLAYNNGPWFGVRDWQARAMVLFSIGLLLKSILVSHPHERFKKTVICCSLLLPFVADSLAVFYWPSLRYLHLVPSVFAFIGLFITASALKTNVFNIVPFARHKTVDLLPDPYFVISSDERIVDFNTAAEKVLGFRKEDLGEDYTKVCDKPFLGRVVASVIKGGQESTQVQFDMFGVKKHFEVVSKKVADAPQGARLYMFKDVTEFEQMNHELAEMNRIKERFFAILAHDVIGNVRSVSYLAHALQTKSGTTWSKQERETIDLIQSSSHQTTVFIDEVLVWARSQVKGLRVIPESTDVTQLVFEVIDFLKPVARVRNIDVQTELSDPVLAEIDKNLVRTVLRNLIDNAIKYSPAHSRIQVSVQSESSGLLVSVTDKGEGLHESDLEALLGQTGSGRMNDGLGLFLSRELVQLHGGRLWSQKRPEGGGRLSFTIPQA